MGTTITLDAGSYSVDEVADSSYTKTLSADCSGTIAAGDTKTCTVTNDDIRPQITVIKDVVNDNGGTKQASDFTINASGTAATPSSFAGNASGTVVLLDAGTYAITETPVAGYVLTSTVDCSGTIAIGESKTCTITNDDQQAQLTVIKGVVNDNGGTAQPSDFTISVTGTNVFPSSFAGNAAGTLVKLDAGSYSVSESASAGYASSLSSDCLGTLAPGEAKTCTVTNDDLVPGVTTSTLIVVKTVINDNGGTKQASDFTMTVSGTNVSNGSFPGNAVGTTITLDAGSYSVDEVADSSYTKTLSADCSGTIAAGDTKTCTVTNDDIAAPVNPPTPPPSGGGGGGGIGTVPNTLIFGDNGGGGGGGGNGGNGGGNNGGGETQPPPTPIVLGAETTGGGGNPVPPISGGGLALGNTPAGGNASLVSEVLGSANTSPEGDNSVPATSPFLAAVSSLITLGTGNNLFGSILLFLLLLLLAYAIERRIRREKED